MSINERFEVEPKVDKGLPAAIKAVLERSIVVECNKVGEKPEGEGPIRRPASLGKIVPQSYMGDRNWQPQPPK
jgi:hypothetical protein